MSAANMVCVLTVAIPRWRYRAVAKRDQAPLKPRIGRAGIMVNAEPAPVCQRLL